MNGQQNKNHAEEAIMSYMQKNYAGKQANITLAIQNGSAKKPGMCEACWPTSVSFAENNPSFFIKIFHGSSGIRK